MSTSETTGDVNGGIADLLDGFRRQFAQPAVAAAVADASGIRASGAAGVRDLLSNHPVSADDRFHIGSCTKAMTATAIASLVEDGTLQWATTVADALGALAGPVHAAYRSATLEQLLQHRAGVRPCTNRPGDDDSPVNVDALRQSLTGTAVAQRAAFVQAILHHPPLETPGQRTLYSNAGYTVAACMAETVTGQSWEALMRDRVFRPLAMATAGFGWPAAAPHPDQPWGHTWDATAQRLLPHAPDDVYRLGPCLGPGGDVHCCIADLARFAREHAIGLQGRSVLLSRETFARLHAPCGAYSMGWNITDVAPIGRLSAHAGSAGTFFAQMVVCQASGMVFAVATNAGTGEAAVQVIPGALMKRFLPGEIR